MAQVFLGTQGWSYKDWVGSFYPPKTQPSDYLAQYTREFGAVELDSTFYGTPLPSRVDGWRDNTPDDFVFTAKMPRTITHDRHLIDSRDELEEFLGAVTRLRSKLGPVLIQMPPSFKIDERPALENFLSILPTSVRFALELRHRSWLNEATFDLLRAHEIAWTMVDLSFMPRQVALTTDFAYVRWLGKRSDIQRVNAVQIDRTDDLEKWAQTLQTVSTKVERLYGFVNNHYSGHSPSDVRNLRRLLCLPETEAAGAPTPVSQGVLL
ncbi:MAG: DUF72 domain-containing protein [Chloroflexota bacterium]